MKITHIALLTFSFLIGSNVIVGEPLQKRKKANVFSKTVALVQSHAHGLFTATLVVTCAALAYATSKLRQRNEALHGLINQLRDPIPPQLPARDDQQIPEPMALDRPLPEIPVILQQEDPETHEAALRRRPLPPIPPAYKIGGTGHVGNENNAQILNLNEQVQQQLTRLRPVAPRAGQPAQQDPNSLAAIIGRAMSARRQALAHYETNAQDTGNDAAVDGW